VAHAPIDRERFEAQTAAPFQTDPDLVGAGPDRYVLRMQRGLTAQAHAAAAVGQRLQHALVPAGYAADLDVNLIALFPDLQPHCLLRLFQSIEHCRRFQRPSMFTR